MSRENNFHNCRWCKKSLKHNEKKGIDFPNLREIKSGWFERYKNFDPQQSPIGHQHITLCRTCHTYFNYVCAVIFEDERKKLIDENDELRKRILFLEESLKNRRKVKNGWFDHMN